MLNVLFVASPYALIKEGTAKLLLTMRWFSVSNGNNSHRNRKTIILAMKLTAIILLSACLMASAKGRSQTVTLSVKNAPLEKVFSKIKQQTGYVFFYSYEILKEARPVTADIRNANLQEALKVCLQGQPLGFLIEDKTVFITKAATSNIQATEPPPPIDVKGRIVNENGEPVIASVQVRGTDKGTTTNDNGEFELKGVSDDAVLVISGINIVTLEINLNGRTDLKITAATRVTRMDEVVINKGYYTERQRLSTGNVSRVRGEDLQKQPVSNPLAALEGRVPGLVVTQQTGVPGGGFSVQIRGRNSIRSEGNDPLYIVDGVPYPSLFTTAQGSAIIGQGSPFNFLNPADIVSIDILKDADATAIYGSRGANGVVLITTKRGTPGKMKLNARFYTGFGEVPKKLDLLNLQEYLAMRHEAFRNDGSMPTAADYSINGVWDTTRSTDWQKELIGGKALYTDAQASVSGGTAYVQYLVGTGYHRESTVFPGDGNNTRGSVHFSLTGASPDKKLNISLTGNYIADKDQLPAFDLTPSIFLPPNAPALYTPEGRLNWQNSTWANPLSPLYKKFTNNTDNLTANLTASYLFSRTFQFKISTGYSNLQSDAINTNPAIANNPAFNSPRSSKFETNHFHSIIVEPQLDYSSSAGKSQFNALAGGTFLRNAYTGRLISASGYPTDELLESVNGASSISVLETQNKEYKYAAAFGRLNYNYDGKYLVNLTGRYDGSSRFGPGRQFHFFHAFGLGWVFSREKFAERALGFLNLGKLRFSYGETGNDQISDYGYLDLYSFMDFLNPYQGTQGLVPIGLFNANYSWEVNKKLELGLELSVLNDRLGFTASYFRNRSSNQLIGYTLPTITGFSNVIANRPALVQNSGVELELNSSNFNNGTFSWKTSFNITVARNKLLAYPGLEGSPDADFFVVGRSLNILKRYQYAGVNPQTGLYQFLNAKGDTTVSPSFATDRIAIVDRMPKFYGGLQNTVRFKNFSLDFLLQFVKQNGYDSELFGITNAGRTNTYNPSRRVLDRWQQPGDMTAIEKFSQSAFGPAYLSYYYASQSDRAYVDASFIRLKNLSLSYEFPALIKRHMKAESLRLFLQAQNLFTLTSYKGMDPETQSVTSLPPLRVLTIGIQISL